MSLAQADSQPLQLRFIGSDPNTRMVPVDRQPGIINRYIGSDATQWAEGLPTYAGLIYKNLYPGIELHYGGQGSTLKGTYTLSPGADPANIRWQYDGAQRIAIDPISGDLLITLTSGRLREHAPIAWQYQGGKPAPVEVRFTLSENQAGFTLGSYDRSRALVIDPALEYGTYVGGSSTDNARSIAADENGNVFITGDTYSSNYPGTTGPRKGSTDVFVTKLNANGNAVVFTTVLGGGDDESGNGIAVDSSGNIWVTGETESEDFATQNPLWLADFSSGFLDTFAAKLSPTGGILFSTYLGVGSNDRGAAIAVDQQGNAYITGEDGASFGTEVFIRKLAADGSQQIYQGFFGAAERGFDKGSSGKAIAVDGEGYAYITGKTDSLVFPVVNPFQAACSDTDGIDCTGEDAFVSVVNPEGTDLIYSTYLGGSRAGSDIGTGSDEGLGIAIDTLGNFTVVGTTFAPDFPVKNAVQGKRAGADNFADGFIAKFTPQGDELVYATYLGGEAWEEARGLALDGDGNAYVIGMTSSDDFPVSANAPQPAIGNGICIVGSTERYCYDGFVTALGASGDSLWSTYLGGNNDDVANGIAYAAGKIYIGGKTESFDFITTNGSYQPTKALSADAFVVKINLAGGTTPPPQSTNIVYLPSVVR